MKILFIINDAPYGNEKVYNALRMAVQVQKVSDDNEVRIFLMADSASSAIANQITPNGYYNIERMLKLIMSKGGKVKICGTCIEARGLHNTNLVEGTQVSTMIELVNWTLDSDKVLTF